MRIAILFSGAGSNMRVLLEKQQKYRVVVAISNRPDAGGISIAKDYGIPVWVIDHKACADRESFEQALLEKLADYEFDLVVLAGFMRILTNTFVKALEDKTINLHPSLLPDFPGLHPHKQALAAGAKTHGATVHLVTVDLDAGPIIAHKGLMIETGETEATLLKRTLAIEHKLLPQVVQWFAEGKITVRAGQVFFQDKPVPATGISVD